MRKVKKPQAGRVPLKRAISKLGAASRTEAEEWIRGGRIKVHGSVETNPDRMVNPDQAHIEINGQKIEKSKSRIILFHKPKGVITTKRDPEGRPTVFDLLDSEFSQFHAVGRLDMHTTGLLLFTNDTKISNFLTDPENEIEREYIVSVRGEITEKDLKRWTDGVLSEGDLLRAKQAVLQKTSGKESRISLILDEGKNREIRRLCEALGHEVTALRRIRYGEFVLGDLEVAKHQEVMFLNEFRLKN